MKAKRRRPSTIPLCIALILIIAPLAVAQSQPSVLSRLQTVEDPDLGELIRVAIDNYRRFHSGNPIEELDIVRAVTESYAGIKLLDQQIEQTERRIDQVASVEVQQELMLAKAELESKRTMELANLRQIMSIMPAHAFGRRLVDRLKTWLVLDVLDDETIVVYAGLQPFHEGRTRHSVVGVMSPAKMLEYVRKQLGKADRLPIRIDIQRTVAGIDQSNRMKTQVIDLARRASREMQAEVHLDDSVWRRGGFELSILKDQVGSERRVLSGLPYLADVIEPNDIRQHIEQLLSEPLHLPTTFELEYDPASKDTVDRVVQTVKETAQRLGMATLLDIKRTVRPVDPQVRYLGQWETVHGDETLRLVLEPGHRARAIEVENGGDTRQTIGNWSLEGEQIRLSMDNDTVTGKIDESGSLVIEADGERIAFTKKGD